ncbi:hypothetical protein ACSF86_07700 [Moraxella bovoculi]|uniref:hypothetical protein n=1 Tax=Moraxella bovoculi TaxID=386891 RepID=UPI003F4FEA0E
MGQLLKLLHRPTPFLYCSSYPRYWSQKCQYGWREFSYFFIKSGANGANVQMKTLSPYVSRLAPFAPIFMLGANGANGVQMVQIARFITPPKLLISMPYLPRSLYLQGFARIISPYHSHLFMIGQTKTPTNND